MMDEKVKPVLKWVGGKRELIPKIRPFYTNLKFGKYIEPFFGGGSVYLDIVDNYKTKDFNNFVINDRNRDLTDLYKNIKTNPNEILKYCQKIEEEFLKYGYYYVRDRFNGITRDKKVVKKYEGIERSAALIVLNKTGFNGLYRTNRSGLYNVPEGSRKGILNVVDKQNLYNLSKILPEVQNIRNGDFNEIQGINKGDLVYFDPPYHPINETSSFTEYSGVFGVNEQKKLKDYFTKLDQSGVYVLESNSATDFIKNLYKDFKIVEVDCRRSVNSKADARGKIKEFLILGNTLSKALE